MMSKNKNSETTVVQAKKTEEPRLTPIQDLICGATAGMTARMIIAPLDVLKIRFQVQSETKGLYQYGSMLSALRNITSYEGFRALWKGNIPALLMVTPYASIQFATFYQLKQSNLFLFGDPYQSLFIGAISASLATISTYPLDLLRTRFAAQSEPRQYKSLAHAVQVIYNSHGVRGLYAGLQPTLFEIIPYISLHFALYESIKQFALEKRQRSTLAPTDSLLIGAISGTSSKFLTYPLDTAKKLMQVDGQFQPSAKSARYKNMAHTLLSVRSQHGIRGWFRGLTPSLVKAAPNSAITFAIYETCKQLLAS